MISANLIVRNEDQYIKRCLEQVCKLADEILVIDTGSTDSTLEKIKNYPITLIQKSGEIRELRNELLNMSSGDWIWIVDGDEVYDNYHLERLCQLVGQDNYAYDFSFRHYMIDEQHESVHKSKTTRLVRKTDNLRWERDFPMEILVDDKGWISSKNKHRNDVKFIDLKYHHFGGLKKQWREQPAKFKKSIVAVEKITDKDI